MTTIVDERWQLRVGGLPADAVDELDDAAHRAEVDRYLAALRLLARDRERISERLHAVIAEQKAQGNDIRGYVAVRRALFKLDAAAVSRALDALPIDERVRLFGALGDDGRALRFWTEFEQAHHDSFESVLMAQRERLRAAASGEGFLQGLALSSPELVSEAERYARERAEKRPVDKRGKRVERSLMSYVLRASAKTTPFSQLGPVAFPGDAAARERDGLAQARAHELHSRSRWSVFPLAHVLSVLPHDRELIDGFTVSRSPYVYRDGETATVDRAVWTFGEVDSRDDYAACTESSVQLHADGVLSLLDEALAEAGSSPSWGDLVRVLCAAGLADDRAHDLVATMVRLGVLVVPSLTIDSFDADDFDVPLTQLAAGSPRGAELAERLRRYRDDAAQIALETDAPARAARVRALREQVVAIYELAGVAAEPPRSVVYEDVLVATAAEHEPPLADVASTSIAAVVAFLDLLDSAHLKRDLVNAYFQRRVSAGEPTDDVAEFLRGLDVELLNSFDGVRVSEIADDALADDPWLTWGGAWRREAARRALVASMTAQQHEVALEGIDVQGAWAGSSVALDDTVARLGQQAGKVRARFRHVNLLVQRDPASGVVVVNDCFGGVGFPVSRFSHVLPAPAARFTDDVEAVAASVGVRLAEISGGSVFSNLNLHEPVLETRLHVPGDPVRGGSADLLLSELRVQWSEEDERVELAQRVDGVIVHPEYAGYLIPIATPQMHQSLALLTPATNLGTKPADLLTAQPEKGHVISRPRMTVGGMVVVRAAVLVRADDLPADDPLTAEGMLAWQRFWARHGLPARSYLRVLSEQQARRAKPFYFDIALSVCVSNLSSRFRGAADDAVVEITESLPDLRPGGDARPRRVAEAMVGVSIIDPHRKKDNA